MSEELTACAAIVERADSSRFRAAMAAPVAARQVLFPLYAFNVEVSRAPWVTAEPMIAGMRLQWWRDALAGIASQGNVRRHEVVTPLAAILTPEDARLLDELVVARSWDIWTEPFADTEELWRYLDHTTGHLMATAARLLGATGPVPVDMGAVRAYAAAAGLANWFLAVPDWLARGRHPLPDTAEAALTSLARQGLRTLIRVQRSRFPKAAQPALLPGWNTGYVLRRAAAHPARVLAGGLTPSPARSAAKLIWQAGTGRI